MTTPTRLALLASLVAPPALAQDVPVSIDVIDADDIAEPPPTGTDSGLNLDTSLRLRPVRVTARRWNEFAQDVPQSVTVVGASTIRDAGITTIRDASLLVPNLIMTEFTSRRLSFPTIRGISTGVGDPSVVTYVDGVPQLQISSTNITLLDVDRLQFLRGPQGTLFGRNALGGVILLETARPSNTPTFSSSATWGDYDLQRYTMSYSGPIVEDTLFISLSGLYEERDGYTSNDVTGNRVDDRRSTFGRVKLLYTPDDRNDIEYTIYSERSRDGAFGLGFLDDIRARPHHIAIDFEGAVDRDILSNALTWEHAGDEVDVTSVSSYVDWDIHETSDFDFTPIDGVRRTTSESQDYFYQELRFASPTDRPVQLCEDAELKWLVGGTAFSSDSDRSASNDFRPGGAGILFPPAAVGIMTDSGDFDDYGLAAFGNATVTLNDDIDLTAGLRYDYENKDADITNVFTSGGFPIFSTTASRDDSYDEWLPSFAAAYHINDDAMLYGRAARGYKAGGFNLSSPIGDETFSTETSWTYEAGIKTSWFDERMTLNAAYFYVDWDDLQLSLFDIVSGGGYVDNAGAATSQGFEIELNARVCEGLDLFATYGLTDAEFDSFTDQFGTDVSGNDLAFVPDQTFSAGAQFGGPLGGGVDWFARAEYQYIGTYNLDAGNTESESYGLASFRAGVQWDNVRIEGWLRNAFDEDYVQVAFQPSPVDPTTFVGENGAPQTMGVTVSIRF